MVRDNKGIFISYRREGTPDYAGRLADALKQRFGEDRVFRDTAYTIKPGRLKDIWRALNSCEVMLVIIGKSWLTVTDARGQPRLEDPHDLVREEIATALERNVRVVPVLVGGATIPRADELPANLADLSHRSGVELRDTAWDHDVESLIVTLEKVLDQPPEDAGKFVVASYGGVSRMPPAQKPGAQKPGEFPEAAARKTNRLWTEVKGEKTRKYDVFISYRRERSGPTARLIRNELTSKKFDTFLDLEGLDSGHFDTSLLAHIANAPNFIVILTPDDLDRRAADEEDWLRKEIAQAIKTERNIVPIMMPGFQFPRSEKLPEDIKELRTYQGVKYSDDYFDAMVGKLVKLMRTDRN